MKTEVEGNNMYYLQMTQRDYNFLTYQQQQETAHYS